MVRQAEDIHLGDVMGILVGGSRDQGPVGVAAVAVQVREKDFDWILNLRSLFSADLPIVGINVEYLLAVRD